MSRFGHHFDVIYFEEPSHADCAEPSVAMRPCKQSGVLVATPQFPYGVNLGAQWSNLRGLLDGLLAELQIVQPILWFYTPMMFAIAAHVEAKSVVYDCMDELSCFRFAPPELPLLERALLARADTVFTGGVSLYEAKRDAHPNIHPFPSSVDTAHFQSARGDTAEPADQASLPRPRLGFYGVVDERMDLDLLAHMAAARPDWSIVIVGPVVKIDPAALPTAPNIHYLGGKPYDELPLYLGGWDVALMPFAINEATQFISPTKTPEYLAGGRPVVSTPVRDVARHYSGLEAVKIASTPDRFVQACDDALGMRSCQAAWIGPVDDLLATSSWDRTFAAMSKIVSDAVASKTVARKRRPSPSRLKRRYRPDAEVLVVGCGLAGSVMAERIASQSNKRVVVIDRRPHVGGNTSDHRDASGLLVNRYGPHVFHTDLDEVVAYLSGFTQWRPYEHRVLAALGDTLVPMPINRTSLNRAYGLDLASDAEVEAFLAGQEGRTNAPTGASTYEDVLLGQLGRDLYDLAFRGTLRKQLGLDPALLEASSSGRGRVRTSLDDRAFTEAFQAVPLHGYTAMVEAMLAHPLIEVRTNTEFANVDRQRFAHIVFTGPIDEYFGFRFGKLPYRSLRFDHVTLDQERFQPVATVEYPDEDIPFLRISEFKHLTGQRDRRTSVVYEYPAQQGEPFYPIPQPENEALFERYAALGRDTEDATFVGRLATYRNCDMDEVVAQALAAYAGLARRWEMLDYPAGARAAATAAE